MYIESYSLFADEDTGMYSHAAPQYNGRPKAKPFIVVLNMNKFSYSDSKQGATSNEFTFLTSFTFKMLRNHHSLIFIMTSMQQDDVTLHAAQLLM